MAQLKVETCIVDVNFKTRSRKRLRSGGESFKNEILGGNRTQVLFKRANDSQNEVFGQA